MSSDKSQQYQTVSSFLVNPEEATPMVRQFLEVKNQYPGIILFYRMGDFYETFFEDALITARTLEITLTGRDAGSLGRIPMAGVPVKALDSYLTRLLNHNFKVAICEQVEDPAEAKGLVKREVVRVLSSGTITEQSLLNPDENNYLAAVTFSKKPNQPCGLAYCDITTGEFNTAQLTYEQLLSELSRIKPVEILVAGRVKKARPGEGFDEVLPDVTDEITGQYQCTPLPPLAFDGVYTTDLLKKLLNVQSLEGFGLNELPMAQLACGVVAHYIQEHFIESPPVLDTIRVYHLSSTVTMSATARNNLELLSTVRNNQYEGSLLSVLNQTTTSMGARLLRQWISQPLTDMAEINTRHDGVEELVNAPVVREALREILPEVYDIERLGSKLENLSANPRDLIALQVSISRLPDISARLKGFNSFYLSRMQDFPPELFKVNALIEQAIDDSPGLNLKEGGIFKAGYHQELDRIRTLVNNQEEWLSNYEAEQRELTGVKNLKVSFNNAFGYFIEVSRANSHLMPESYHRKQTLTNAERFTTDILKSFESEVLDAQSRQYDLEYELFVELRKKLQPYARVIKDCAHRVAVLDVLQSLASIAVQKHYVRPVVDESYELNIQEGRHPVVEHIVPFGQFVPNHSVLSAADKEYQIPQQMIITGPNMAGKSTYMRQVALIVLMAQMGSFVPASYARIGLVDGVFTRVGAVDDLSSGQSTFMVEMNETASILNGATRRSLVLLDEVGRGTSTFDGVSIAWAVSEYLVNHIGCRTLFATHYHELNTLEAQNPKVQNYRVCISEENGEIEFLHKVEPGSAQKSYGIQVAKMAGLPKEVIQRADGILSDLQKKDIVVENNKKAKNPPKQAETPQLNLF